MSKRNSPSFSVIIPTHNRATLVVQTIESVLAQTRPAREIITVNDGSTDDTAEVLRQYGNRVRVIDTKGLGPGGARNAGAAVATSDYLSFVDSDDLWRPATLETVATTLTSESVPAMVILRFRSFTGEPDRLPEGAPQTLRVSRFASVLTGRPGAPPVNSGSIAAVSRQLFQEVGGFASEIRCWEDADFGMRIGTHCPVLVVESPILLDVRTHPMRAHTNLAAWYEGVSFMLSSERAGKYPGGASMVSNRERWLSSISLSAATQLARAGHLRLSLDLLSRSAGMAFRSGDYRSIARVPLACVRGAFARSRSHLAHGEQVSR